MAPNDSSKKKDKTKKSAGRRKPFNKDNATNHKDKIPGVQKIKSSLRQTRRLLAKDNLAADVRIQTERRLKSLEKDLANAEQASKERNMAARYHKVKFFERQKVVRKINQTKRTLEQSADSSAQSHLQELRVDLNYILHYPKTKKYISLFPPSPDDPSASETNDERQKLREWIRGCMEKGELPQEPEINLSEGNDSDKTGSRHTSSSQWNDMSGTSKKGHPPIQEDGRSEEEQDEFFGEDDDDLDSD